MAKPQLLMGVFEANWRLGTNGFRTLYQNRCRSSDFERANMVRGACAPDDYL